MTERTKRPLHERPIEMALPMRVSEECREVALMPGVTISEFQIRGLVRSYAERASENMPHVAQIVSQHYAQLKLALEAKP